MIYCIGDSFTYGDELADRQKSAWPALVGNYFNKPVTNLGRRAVGNTRIVKRTIDAAFAADAELIIIAWASPYRTEFFNDIPYDIWAGMQTDYLNEEQASLARSLTLVNNKQFDLWQYRKWLRDVILIQNLLQNQNKNYMMFMAYTPWGPIPGTEDLWDKVNSQYFMGHAAPSNNIDRYENFGHWAAGCPKGPGGHPLELAHQKVANKINEYIRNLSWLS